MRVALYARVSTESQQARGTIGSQLAVLRDRVGVEGEEVVAEFCDDGHSGARLDRPGLDALRDAAEAGLIERVWCLSADRCAPSSAASNTGSALGLRMTTPSGPTVMI